MTTPQTHAPEPNQQLSDVLVACLEAIDRGQPPDPQDLLARYPEFGAELNRFFADQGLVDRWTAPLRRVVAAATPRPEETVQPMVGGPGGELSAGGFGDYEILEELGSGGMGRVYRARQKSLGRTVALKVIRADRLASPGDAQRFRNEAEMAAGLDHPNIVPVYEVADHAGQLYFSMKQIEGGSLAQQLDRFAADPKAAARLVAQVARAVHHAHQRGILHRDLKPANILLDQGGQPHITDFGLAKRIEVDSSLTQPGMLVGTPSYMAPEQALGKKGAVTTATDVYGLGAVLYALLTGRPPFHGETVLETLEQVKAREPEPASKSNPRVDRDLETVCLKCLDKDPHQRYGSAEALAEDLERWRAGEPIRARPLGRAARLWRWGWRNPRTVAAALAVLVAVLTAAAMAGWAVADRRARRAEAEVRARAALEEADRWRQGERWSEALSAVRRAQEVLRGLGADAQLEQQVDELGKDLQMAQWLEEARLQMEVFKDGQLVSEANSAAYAAAFAWYGLDVEHGNTGEVAAYIRSRPVRMQLVAALDDWAFLRRRRGDRQWSRLLAVAHAADSDAWRNRLRDAWQRGDGKALDGLLASADVAGLPHATLQLLAPPSRKVDSIYGERLAALWRRAGQRHPAEFWIHENLGSLLHKLQPPQLEEAIHHLMVAVALRPQSPGAHNNLGVLLKDRGKLDEAITEYREAVRLKKDFAEAHNNLGVALKAKGQSNEAITEWREATRINKDQAEAHTNLGAALAQKGQLDEAIAEFREAIRLKNSAMAHNNLGNVLDAKGRLDEAIAEYREAIRLKGDFPEAYCNLGEVLERKGQLAEALVYRRRGHELGSKNPRWPHPSAQWVRNCERLVELDGKLPAILNGQKQPADAAERIGLAQLCQMPCKKRYAAAVQFFRDAFAEQPKLADDLNRQHRYNAACAAALAGSGQGADGAKLDTQERARLRQQALHWLRAELKAWARLLEKGPAQTRAGVVQQLKHWLADPGFAGVRGEEALSRLPAAERQAWEKLWADVREMLAKAGGPSGRQEPPEKKP
jgi:serine/threonine-protein kinase